MIKYKKYLDDVVRYEVDKDKSQYEWRLDQSERITEFPKKFWDDWIDSIKQTDFITYPYVNQLKTRLSKHYGVKNENVFITPGSDIGIRTMFDVFVTPGSEVLSTFPCFPMYEVYSQLYQARFRQVPYEHGPDWPQTEGLYWPIDIMLDRINENTSLVIIANPNNPIGDFKPSYEMKEIFEKTQDMGIPVLIDEAYAEFVERQEDTCIKTGLLYDNVMTSRTFSKAKGAAGVRIGYVISNKFMIEKLMKFRMMHEITGPAAKFGIHILDNYDVVEDYVKATNESKAKLIEMFEPTEANVIGGDCNWIHLHDWLDNEFYTDILDKYDISYKAGCTIPYDGRDNWLRLTVGPGLENTKFIKEMVNV